MADRIVQLKDKAGDNIYPIAGNPAAPVASSTTLGMVKVGTSMKIDANSNLNVNENGVTTGKIADGAVTTAKLADGNVTLAKLAASVIDKNFLPTRLNKSAYTYIPNGSNLNDAKYRQIGTYYASGDANVNNIANRPFDRNLSFMMNTMGIIQETISETTAWQNLLQVVRDYQGHIYERFVSSGATAGQWTYGAWREVVTSDKFNYTTTDPGKNSSLEVNKITFVYEN